MPAGDSNDDSYSWFELLVIATHESRDGLCEVMIMSTTIKSPEELTIFAQVDRNWLKHQSEWVCQKIWYSKTWWFEIDVSLKATINQGSSGFSVPKQQHIMLLKIFSVHMAVCQNLVPQVNIKIAGKWMFIP